MAERLLRLAALLAAQAAVDHHDRLLAPEHRGDAPAQIRQRVAMLGEDDQLLRRSGLRGRGRRAIGGQDLAEQPGELPPLGVRAAAPHSERELLHVPQRPDLGLQLRDRPGGGRLIQDLLGRLLLLVGRRVLQVLELVGVQLDVARQPDAGHGLTATAQQLQLAQAALKPLPAPPQRLVDRLR